VNALELVLNPKRRIFLRGTASLAATGFLGACGGSSANGSTAVEPTDVPTGVTPTSVVPVEPVQPVPPAAPAPLPTPPVAPVPAWAASVPTDTWHTFASTAFLPWARANIPPGAYQGTNPLVAIVNAYCDPAYDPWAGRQVFYGGGHGDGTCNALCAFDHASLQWTLVGQPTPPAKYPPSYVNGGSIQPGPLVYPSGVAGNGFFLSAKELSAPEDLPYATDPARQSSHMYAAAAMRGTTVHYFYGIYAEFDTATGKWVGRSVDLGAQLYTFRPQYNSNPLQQGTVATYDEVTDRFYVTLNPGDSGGGWRSGIIVFDPTTRRIESIHETNASTYGLVNNSISVVRVGRRLYCFTKKGTGYDKPQAMNQGFTFDMDTRTYKAFVLTGSVDGTIYPYSSSQETIPAFYDGVAIRRWNYALGFRDKIFSVDLTPIAGEGTPAAPFVLSQTERTIAGTPPQGAAACYSRFVYNGGARCAMLLPHATSDWVALKLS
jgi:hypothetical protein